jgi:hypothetical protein
MPWAWGYGEFWRDQRARVVKAKLKKLGINPRGTKYNTLFFRWMTQR